MKVSSAQSTDLSTRALYPFKVDVREELVDFQAPCQPSLNFPSQSTLHRAVFLKCLRCSPLAADHEIITVLGKYPVRVFGTIIGQEHATNSHNDFEMLYDSKNGGRALVPSNPG